MIACSPTRSGLKFNGATRYRPFLPGLGRLLLPTHAPLPRRIAVLSPRGNVLHRRFLCLDPSPMHIVWDWNGTLLDDNDAALAGINAVCADHGRPAITLDTWRTLFRRPPRKAYEELLQTALTDTEFHGVTQIFDIHSSRARSTCSLAATARWALTEWSTTGHTQSLLSMTSHTEIIADTAARNVASYFTAIDGRTDTGEPAKSALLREHLTRHGINPAMAVLIGDSTDDAHAACAAGAHSILVATGTTNRARLDTTGAPVVDTIPDAIRLLGLASTIPGINAHRHHTGTR
ncbi:MAG: HAD family hydrolase [Pseudonocardiaceae bacterium]